MTDTAHEDQPTTSYFQRLRNGEEHWAWKFGFRVTICIANFVGIGCAAWLASQTFAQNVHYGNPYIGYFDYVFLPGNLAAVRHSLPLVQFSSPLMDRFLDVYLSSLVPYLHSSLSVAPPAQSHSSWNSSRY